MDASPTIIATCHRCPWQAVKLPDQESYDVLLIGQPWEPVRLIPAGEFGGHIRSLICHFQDAHRRETDHG